jgi:ankyrin repeat protein
VGRLLGDGRVDVNAAKDGWSALMIASANGHEAVVGRLLGDGRVDVNRRSTDGVSALLCAAAIGAIDVVRRLLAAAGISVNDGTPAWTPFTAAVATGNDAVVELLCSTPGFDAIASAPDAYFNLTATCTFAATQREFTAQPWRECITCGLTSGEGACAVCVRECHEGHALGPWKFSLFFCDCGVRGHEAGAAQTE